MHAGQQASFFPALKKPYIFAHQGGELLAPTNTMAAFALADSLGGVDFLDIDVHMTRDGHLVGIHDATVDRTTNGHGRVDTFTLAELQRLDAGYHFQDLQDQYSYRGKGVYIPTLDEIFQTYSEKYHLHFEVKDVYPQPGPSMIEEKLWALIQRYHMQQRVIVASFKQQIVSRFQQLTGGQIASGASSREVTSFVLAHKVHLPILFQKRSTMLEIPTRRAGVTLKDARLIERAHQQGMDVYYWTIDTEEEMRELITLGADGIFTNRPDILRDLLRTMQLRP